MSDVVTRNDTTAGQDYEAISPYLRRPLRSFKDYLRERARSRKQSERTAPAEADASRERNEQDGSSDQEGRDERDQ